MSEMSAAEAAIVARFDAAEPAPESWRGDDGLRARMRELAAEWESSPPDHYGDGYHAGFDEGQRIAARAIRSALAEPC